MYLFINLVTGYYYKDTPYYRQCHLDQNKLVLCFYEIGKQDLMSSGYVFRCISFVRGNSKRVRFDKYFTQVLPGTINIRPHLHLLAAP